MKEIILGGAMLTGVGFAVLGGFQLGELGGKPFDYATASDSEREAYLIEIADNAARGMRSSLVSSFHNGRSFRLVDTRIDHGAQKVEYVVRVTGGTKVSSQQFNRFKKGCWRRLALNF